MRRRPYSAKRKGFIDGSPVLADLSMKDEWLTSIEAAIHLKKFRRKDGKPSIGAIHSMVWREKLPAIYSMGRLVFRRSVLDSIARPYPKHRG